MPQRFARTPRRTAGPSSVTSASTPASAPPSATTPAAPSRPATTATSSATCSRCASRRLSRKQMMYLIPRPPFADSMALYSTPASAPTRATSARTRARRRLRWTPTCSATLITGPTSATSARTVSDPVGFARAFVAASLTPANRRGSGQAPTRPVTSARTRLATSSSVTQPRRWSEWRSRR